MSVPFCCEVSFGRCFTVCRCSTAGSYRNWKLDRMTRVRSAFVIFLLLRLGHEVAALAAQKQRGGEVLYLIHSKWLGTVSRASDIMCSFQQPDKARTPYIPAVELLAITNGVLVPA